MLHRMQAKYADKPVRFLLFPCNQFANQEPKSNSDIKQFAENSVSLAQGSNVVMFAKSNLNGLKCTTSGPETCTPASAGCCPANDGVYDYLLAATPPHNIIWNFDKIVVGKDGKPYVGEQILHGPDVDEKLSSIFDELLAEENSLAAPGGASSAGLLLAGAAAAAAVFGVVGLRGATKKESSEGYYLVVA